MAVPSSLLSPILRSDVQGRILAELFARPDQERTIVQIAQSAKTSPQTVIREINLAEQAGIVSSRRLGNVRLVHAEENNRLYQPYSQIILMTYGPPAVLREEFSNIKGISEVIIFGSWAARYAGKSGKFPNDIDVLAIGEPNRKDIYSAAERAEARLEIPVQVTVRSTQLWSANSDPFIREIRKKPYFVVFEDGHL